MQFTYAALVTLLASAAYAQSIQDEIAKLPACSVPCLQDGATAAGCGQTDYTCQCGPGKDAITKSVIPCLAKNCQASDLTTVTDVTTEICNINAASGGGAASSSAASSAAAVSSTSSSAAASAASSSAAASSAAASSAASSASSASKAASSAASSPTSAAAGGSSAASSPTSSAPAQKSANAGSSVRAAGAVVGAAVMAAFAL